MVSCRTTSACRRRSRAVCAGESNLSAPLGGEMRVEGRCGMVATRGSSASCKGVVGGVKKSLSLELSSRGPIASGHLQSHLQTAARTCLTSTRAKLRENEVVSGLKAQMKMEAAREKSRPYILWRQRHHTWGRSCNMQTML